MGTQHDGGRCVGVVAGREMKPIASIERRVGEGEMGRNSGRSRGREPAAGGGFGLGLRSQEAEEAGCQE